MNNIKAKISMENNEGRLVGSSEGDGPKWLWTIDYDKCTVCGECVDACMRGLLKVEKKRIVITTQADCNWCGACGRVCASHAIELT